MATFAMPELIRRKRDGGRLADDEIHWIIAGVTDGSAPDAQVAALLMAIFWRGMDPAELSTWTRAMVESGTRLDLSSLTRRSVDKHSTGGIGDGVSLILCPLMAACGAAVPQLSGRGLGHTGGTLDKLESIPGWRADLSGAEFIRVLDEVGAVICAAGPDLAPADKRLYALRDVTATVESIPLIASSIMSKKIAEGTEALVLDVKVGRGAFMQDLDRARELAATMVAIGADHDVRTSALLTDMDTPLGRAAGNALEVNQAVEVLRGGGPSDLVEVTVELAREMTLLAGLEVDPAQVLASGRALPVWDRMIRAQGGDPDAVLARAAHVETVTAPVDGVMIDLNPMSVGMAAWYLGAGRSTPGASVSATAGVIWHATVGDPVTAGQVLFELHTDDAARFPAALGALEGGWILEAPGTATPERQLVIDTIR